MSITLLISIVTLLVVLVNAGLFFRDQRRKKRELEARRELRREAEESLREFEEILLTKVAAHFSADKVEVVKKDNYDPQDIVFHVINDGKVATQHLTFDEVFAILEW